MQVLLSYRCSAERELATDDAGEPTIISAGGGAQEAVELRTVSPQYLGAVVVCDGADSASVRLAIISVQSSSVTGRIRRRCSSPSRRQWHSLPA